MLSVKIRFSTSSSEDIAHPLLCYLERQLANALTLHTNRYGCHPIGEVLFDIKLDALSQVTKSEVLPATVPSEVICDVVEEN